MIRCTIGVMAYNEEANIVQILHALLGQQRDVCDIVEIIVVASGCTDRTVPLAESVARAYPLVRLDVQAKRAGKAAAINRLIELAQGDVIVLTGADTLPDPTAIEQLVQPFEDASVGMTGGRIVPLNDPRTVTGFAVQMLWYLHHQMALQWPKLGEMVAFRNVVHALPVDSATDEVALEALVSAQGYRLVYVPEAVVYNRGPQTLYDLILQRRRIYAGHLHMAATLGYVAASMNAWHLMQLGRKVLDWHPKLLLLMSLTVLIECWARLLGALDFWRGHSHHIWRPVKSTKKVQMRDSLTLVAVQCRSGSIRTARVLDRVGRDSTSPSLLCWWDSQCSQVLFSVATDQLNEDVLEAQINRLAATRRNASAPANSAMLMYRVVQFTTPPGAVLNYQ
jgi:poly-beta-1,6-N-acetyl-D-glucosamine synthase